MEFATEPGYQPIVEALNFIKSQLHSQTTFYSELVYISIEGALKNSYHDIVMRYSAKVNE